MIQTVLHQRLWLELCLKLCAIQILYNNNTVIIIMIITQETAAAVACILNAALCTYLCSGAARFICALRLLRWHFAHTCVLEQPDSAVPCVCKGGTLHILALWRRRWDDSVGCGHGTWSELTDSCAGSTKTFTSQSYWLASQDHSWLLTSRCVCWLIDLSIYVVFAVYRVEMFVIFVLFCHIDDKHTLTLSPV